MPTYRGVLYRARKGTYRAKIYHGNRSVWLGSFARAEDAAMAYDAAARFLHGPDAVLNFPHERPPVDIRAKVATVMVERGLLEVSSS